MTHKSHQQTHDEAQALARRYRTLLDDAQELMYQLDMIQHTQDKVLIHKIAIRHDLKGLWD